MRLGKIVLALAGFISAVLLNPTAAIQAQLNATIQGSLTDPSGAAVEGATVSAQPLDSPSPATQTRSGRDGKYALRLAPGRYRVTIEGASFKRVTEGFTLKNGEIREWNARLELEPFSAHVVVTAAAEPTTLETTAAPVDTITRDEIDERQQTWITPLLASVPGASFSQLALCGDRRTQSDKRIWRYQIGRRTEGSGAGRPRSDFAHFMGLFGRGYKFCASYAGRIAED